MCLAMSSSASQSTNPELISEVARAAAHRAYRATQRTTLIDKLARVAKDTDSPIEAMFAAWFNASRDHLLSEGCSRFALTIRPQTWVEANGRNYFLDFSLEPQDPWLRDAFVDAGLSMRVGLELDGHAFHERTKEQVADRNRRDRDLSSAGWLILHFSGSELHANPILAVVEVLETGANALDQAKAALLHKGD
jgi:very-short-patch-repair endonuclease